VTADDICHLPKMTDDTYEQPEVVLS
jgi:hypothetical protein